jgi:hypothetical protein
MTKEQARRAVLAEWDPWTKATNVNNANGRDGLTFFGFVQRERPQLLAFRASGDKWQTVHSWLFSARLVSD